MELDPKPETMKFGEIESREPEFTLDAGDTVVMVIRPTTRVRLLGLDIQTSAEGLVVESIQVGVVEQLFAGRGRALRAKCDVLDTRSLHIGVPVEILAGFDAADFEFVAAAGPATDLTIILRNTRPETITGTMGAVTERL